MQRLRRKPRRIDPACGHSMKENLPGRAIDGGLACAIWIGVNVFRGALKELALGCGRAPGPRLTCYAYLPIGGRRRLALCVAARALCASVAIRARHALFVGQGGALRLVGIALRRIATSVLSRCAEQLLFVGAICCAPVGGSRQPGAIIVDRRRVRCSGCRVVLRERRQRACSDGDKQPSSSVSDRICHLGPPGNAFEKNLSCANLDMRSRQNACLRGHRAKLRRAMQQNTSRWLRMPAYGYHGSCLGSM